MGALAGAVAYGSVVYAIDPYEPRSIGCPIHRFTGGYCPGCGSTRAAHELLHGDIVASVAAHPLLIPVCALLAFLWVGSVIRRRRPAEATPAGTDVPWTVSAGLAASFVVLTLARNTIGWLAPPSLAG